MGGFGKDSGREEGDLSWTNEALPLEIRRALLDQALEELRKARAAGGPRPGVVASLDRPGQSGSERASPGKKDKPKA
jgi:hypothetical protein